MGSRLFLSVIAGHQKTVPFSLLLLRGRRWKWSAMELKYLWSTPTPSRLVLAYARPVSIQTATSLTSLGDEVGGLQLDDCRRYYGLGLFDLRSQVTFTSFATSCCTMPAKQLPRDGKDNGEAVASGVWTLYSAKHGGIGGVSACFWCFKSLYIIMVEGSLEVKLPTVDGKAEVGRVREKKPRSEKIREEKEWEERRCGCEKVGKSRFTVFFPMICGSGGSKSWLAKAAGAEPSGQMRNEKLHAVSARSTFPSQNVQNTLGSDHSWTLRCWKSARRCGAQHISKSKCTKHTTLSALLKLRGWKSARHCGAKHISKSKV